MHALRQYNERFIVGQVEKGKQLGRTFGFPTANLNLVENFTLENGVYGVYVYHQTFEVHMLDFDECIYDENLIVEMMFYIRGEKKFSQLQELISQLQMDAFYTRKKYLNVWTQKANA